MRQSADRNVSPMRLAQAFVIKLTCEPLSHSTRMGCDIPTSIFTRIIAVANSDWEATYGESKSSAAVCCLILGKLGAIFNTMVSRLGSDLSVRDILSLMGSGCSTVFGSLEGETTVIIVLGFTEACKMAEVWGLKAPKSSHAVSSVLMVAEAPRCAANNALMVLSCTGQLIKWWLPEHRLQPFH